LLKYWDFFKETLNFGALRLIQVTINPVTMLLVRSLIIKKIGLAENGFFDAFTRISVLYAPFITNILWSYTFPIYCENRDNRQLANEINKFIRLSFILFIPVCVTLMLFGNFVVTLLFSRGFAPIIPLLYLWFLLDLFRVTSWPMNIVFIAKDRMKLAVSLEALWNAVFLFSAYRLIGRYSLNGVVFSYVLSFAIFLIINYLIMKKKYSFKFNPRTVLAFLVSAVLIFIAGRPVKSLPDFIFIFFLSLVFFYSVLDKKEMLLIRDVIKKRTAESPDILNKNEEF
jgi:PST family polysaccharide transporter